MWQQIKQVGMAYWTRPAFWLLSGIAVLFGIPLLWVAMVAPRHNPDTFSHAIFMPVVALTVLFAAQSKLQFAHCRSRLTPGFAAPHLFWTVAGILLAAIGFPLLLAHSSVTHPLPMLCWTGCVVASFVWAIHSNSPTAGIIALAMLGSLVSKTVYSFWGFPAPKVTDSAPIHLWPLLAIAWGTIIAWLIRLTNQHEEMDEYEFQIRFSNWDRSPRAARLEGRNFRLVERSGLWRISRWFVDWWHDRIAIRTKRGTATREFLSQYGFLATPGYTRAAWMAIFLFAMGMIMGAFTQPRANYGAMIMVASFSFFFPPLMNHTYLVQRWPRLSSEMLMPHTREQWIDGLLRALQRMTALGAAAMQLILVLMCMIWFPKQVTFGAVIGFLLLVSCIVYLGTATTIWVTSHSRGLSGNFLCSVLILPQAGTCVLWLWLRESSGEWIVVLLAMPIALAGWLMMGRARQRWLEVELGR